MNNNYSLSIVIPCRNEKDYIENCVNKLLSQTHFIPDVEIIIVDGMSEDGTREIIDTNFSTNPNVRLIDNPKKVTPVAFNLGIKHAKGFFLMIIGVRNILSDNYIKEAIDDLQNKSEVACSGGKVINLYTNSTSKAISFAMGSSFGVGSGNFRTLTKSQYTDTIGVPVYKREIFTKVGLFDERLIRNQDDEFNYRLLQGDFKIWHNTNIENRYYVRGSYKNLFHQYQQYGYWKVFVNQMHNTITTVRQIFPVLLVLYLLILPFFLLIPFTFLRILSLLPLFMYIIGGLFFGIKASKEDFKMIPGVLLSFLLLHIGYGWGYLKGIIDFLILHKDPTQGMEQLTR